MGTTSGTWGGAGHLSPGSDTRNVMQQTLVRGLAWQAEIQNMLFHTKKKPSCPPWAYYWCLPCHIWSPKSEITDDDDTSNGTSVRQCISEATLNKVNMYSRGQTFRNTVIDLKLSDLAIHHVLIWYIQCHFSLQPECVVVWSRHLHISEASVGLRPVF